MLQFCRCFFFIYFREHEIIKDSCIVCRHLSVKCKILCCGIQYYRIFQGVMIISFTSVFINLNLRCTVFQIPQKLIIAESVYIDFVFRRGCVPFVYDIGCHRIVYIPCLCTQFYYSNDFTETFAQFLFTI